MPTIHSINVNPAGGVPKRAVRDAIIHVDRVVGDKQRNLKYHGGPLRAVCLYSLERIEALQAEGHPITPGSTGENLTIQGLDWNIVTPGTKLAIGDGVLLEVTTYTAPCKNIAGSFTLKNFMRSSQDRHPGWSRVYAKVLRPGTVKVGDSVTME